MTGSLPAAGAEPSGGEPGRSGAVDAAWGRDAPTLTSLTGVLHRGGVPALVLLAPEEHGDAHEFGQRTIKLLIPRDKRGAALQCLETMDWRYRLGAAGAWRLLPGVNYWWSHMNVLLYWGLPTQPFPPFALRRLERALWDRAHEHPDGYLVPDPAALLVHLAFQATRPGWRNHRYDFEHFVACRRHVEDAEQGWRIATAAGLRPALQSALEADDAGSDGPHPGPVFGGVLAPAWRAAIVLQNRARPSWVGGLLAGTFQLGNARVRCRIADVEVLSGPRVFVPTPDAELFVDLTLERISGTDRPTIIEIGTGSGGIALALARAHPGAAVHASDTSRDAVRWARRNARRLRLRRVRFSRGSLLEPFARATLEGKVTVVLANLPFYPSHDYASIGAVPRDTIEGQGEDGLELVRSLARDARELLEPGGWLVLQMFDWQWERFTAELTELGYRPGTPRRSGPFAIGPAELP